MSDHDYVPFFNGLFHLQHIQRYPREYLARRQTVAEHSFNVGILAWQIALWYHKKIANVEPTHVLVGALLHDYPEHLTGDLDYRVKHFNGEIESTWNQMEYLMLKDFTARHEHPEPVRTLLTLMMIGSGNDNENLIVKLADYLEFCAYCTDEVERGNQKSKEWFRTGLEIVDKALCELHGMIPEYNGAKDPAYQLRNHLAVRFRQLSGEPI